ncbi:hypothetical protein Peur_043126 [Populus x canadensis]
MATVTNIFLNLNSFRQNQHGIRDNHTFLPPFSKNLFNIPACLYYCTSACVCVRELNFAPRCLSIYKLKNYILIHAC